MLEFVKTFDLLGSITQFLQERRQSLGISDDNVLRPRLLNQERGGLLIYTWNDLSEDVKVKSPVTHVGVYDPSSQKHKVIWIYNQKVRIVSCSLNRERTLLGFTIVTRQEAGQDGKSKADVYQAFLAELQSLDTRVFSLNLQRHAFLKAQFLYPDANPAPSSSSSSSASGSSRHSYMVIMLHKESVGLYKIPMARIGDRGIMMSGQPTTEQIVRKFVWCQWDSQNQRLYYIHNVKQTSSHADSVGHKLSAIQFHSGSKFDNMIDVPINFPFPYIRSSSRVAYADIPLHPGMPDAAVNIVVLSQPNGSMCLCYQEYLSSRPRPSTTSLMTLPEEDPDAAAVDVNYYVCMVHHAKTLHGCAAGLPRAVVAGKRIVFQWFGEYLVATMPGVFCHLLNVSLDFEPCHHILLHNHDIPTTTKPLVPSRGDNSQSLPKATTRSGGKSPATTSTDTSDLAASSRVTATGVRSPSSKTPDGDDPQAQTSGSTSESSKADHSDPSVVSPRPSPGLHPTSPDLAQGASSSTPSPLPGLNASPKMGCGAGDLPDTLSAIDGECFPLSVPLVSCFGFFRETGSLGPNLYDASSGVIWRLASNPDRLIKAFRSAYWSSQLAMLHYLILLRTRDIFTIKQVFEVLTADPTGPEIPIFLSEYLVASTFASMRKKSDKETTELLSFTSADTFRGQFEKNSQGERLARVTYTSLDSVNISTKVSQERRRRPSEDSWDLLRRSLRLKQMPPPSRFSHQHVQKALQKDIDSSTLAVHSKKWMWVNQELEASFFDGMHTVKLTDVPAIRSSSSEAGGSGGRQSRTETVLGTTPLFLQATQSSKSELKRKNTALTEQLLISHLFHHLKKESRIKAQNIAREYITCQVQQCQLLCHMLWSIHTEEETTAYEHLLPNLKDVGMDKEYQLFQVYERVFLVSEELVFPRPPGFSSYFTSLGFKCLSSGLFLQYVDRGILQLTPDFILQLLDDLPDNADDSNAETKFNIISRLPKPFAEDCFQRWKHPALLKAAAQQQAAQVLHEGLMTTYRRSDSSADAEDRAKEARSRSITNSTDGHSGDSAEKVSFKPLAIFIRHLEDTALEVQRQKPGSMSLMYDTNIIEEAALSFTRHHDQFDLSTMNF